MAANVAMAGTEGVSRRGTGVVAASAASQYKVSAGM
jgi:hypothetical protein